jgi:hypothetical protein
VKEMLSDRAISHPRLFAIVDGQQAMETPESILFSAIKKKILLNIFLGMNLYQQCKCTFIVSSSFYSHFSFPSASCILRCKGRLWMI